MKILTLKLDEPSTQRGATLAKRRRMILSAVVRDTDAEQHFKSEMLTLGSELRIYHNMAARHSSRDFTQF